MPLMMVSLCLGDGSGFVPHAVRFKSWRFCCARGARGVAIALPENHSSNVQLVDIRAGTSPGRVEDQPP